MYKRMKVRIPSKTHDKLKLLITQDKKIPVKIGLEEGDDELLLTPGQILKMHHAKNDGKNLSYYASVESRYERIFIMKGDFLRL